MAERVDQARTLRSPMVFLLTGLALVVLGWALFLSGHDLAPVFTLPGGMFALAAVLLRHDVRSRNVPWFLAGTAAVCVLVGAALAVSRLLGGTG